MKDKGQGSGEGDDDTLLSDVVRCTIVQELASCADPDVRVCCPLLMYPFIDIILYLLTHPCPCQIHLDTSISPKQSWTGCVFWTDTPVCMCE